MEKRKDRHPVNEWERRADTGPSQTRLFMAAVIVCASVIAGAGAIESHQVEPDQTVAMVHH